MLVASTAAAILLVVTLGVLLVLIRADRERMKDTRVAVAQLQAESDKISAEQGRLEGTLRQPVNAVVLQRSMLLNQLLERKSISWTKIFADLESVLPIDVRLVAVRLPHITSGNEVVLDVEVGAKEPVPFMGFLNRLNKSPLFGPVDLKSKQSPTLQEPLYKYRFTVNYAQKL
jgi:Tfp pilus assembly protein PilN